MNKSSEAEVVKELRKKKKCLQNTEFYGISKFRMHEKPVYLHREGGKCQLINPKNKLTSFLLSNYLFAIATQALVFQTYYLRSLMKQNLIVQTGIHPLLYA